MRYKIRRENFAKIREGFKTNVALSAALTDEESEVVFSPSYISQLLSGHRGIGDDVADKIEDQLNLPRGTLDNVIEAIPLQDADTEAVVNLFSWVYQRVSEEGKTLLRNTIKAVSKAYLQGDRRIHALDVIKDRRS